MKMPSISDMQKELKTYSPGELLSFCMRLAKHKKENKELLCYLMYEATDEKSYVEHIKTEIDQLFGEINKQSTYTTKKGLQKVVRLLNRYVNFSKERATEVELRIYFCKKMQAERIDLSASSVIFNLYEREKTKIYKNLTLLHEDLQYDFTDEVKRL